MNDLNALTGSELDVKGPDMDKYISLIHILKGQEEYFLNCDGIIISSNLEAVNITGYEEYEVLGKHISQLYIPHEKSKSVEDLEKAKTLGQTFVTGLKVKKRGTTFWAKMRIRSLQNGEPGSPKYKVCLQDVTHRALSNLRVQTIKDEYLAIFNNPFVGAFKFRIDDYRILRCNQKMLEIINREESSDLYFNNLFHSPTQFIHFISLLRDEKRIEGFKFLIQDDKNSEDNWAVVSVRYFESHGFAEGVLLDISEQHNQMLELQRVNAELDNFTYHASHDLRAPLTTMLGLVNLGLIETSAENIQTYLKMIQERIGHLDGLLKDLISVSYNNKTQINFELIDLKQEVEEIVKSLEHPRHQFKIEIDIQGEKLISDAVRIRTIFRNLLSNAFKYHNPDIENPYIKLSAQITSSKATITLEDNGIGINQEHKDKIYEMFFRGTAQSNGSGLGLFIVKSMVDKLKGQIGFESTVKKGTTFRLTLPNEIE